MLCEVKRSFQRPKNIRGRILLVGVPCNLIVHHHTVNETLGQQARVLLSQLQSAQPAQVLALKSKPQITVRVALCVCVSIGCDVTTEGWIPTWKNISCVFFGICLTPESPNSPDTHTQGSTVAMAMLSFFMGIITTRYGIPRERHAKSRFMHLSLFFYPTLLAIYFRIKFYVFSLMSGGRVFLQEHF